MEHLDTDYLGSDDVLVAEHRHRYLWAARYLAGDILDLACGYGYGSEILAASTHVRSYVGIDASEAAIAHAGTRFASPARRFLNASATAIPLPDASVDAIVSLETLEHLPDPSLAVAEFRRVLRPGGVVVGSVPSRYFDDRAEQVYGPNPYHVTRFGHDELRQLLAAQFPQVRVYYSALQLVTHIGSLQDGRPVMAEPAEVVREAPASEVSGSFQFVACDAARTGIDALHQARSYFGLDLIEFDARKVMPLRALVAQNEAMVRQKDQVIAEAEQLIRERDQRIHALEARIAALSEPAQLVDRIIARARRALGRQGTKS